MDNWKSDQTLKQRLLDLIKKSYKQKELLQFVTREFKEYSWSLRTLQRRLNYFGLKWTDKTIDPERLLNVVKGEVSGPGGLLGIRALHHKIRNHHGLLVARNDVYLAMNLTCPDKLEERRLTTHRKKFKRREYISKGPNWTWSIDGHDKLSGRWKSEFPFGIHGGIDTFSRKVLWLVIWPSNCNPLLPARLFFNAIIKHGYFPCRTRSDRGSENVTVAAMQNFLTGAPGNRPNHIFGSSMTNQVIEQWWKGFRERHGEFFKSITNALVRSGYYDDSNSTCRVVLAAVFLPIIQNELDTFKIEWNSHRIRKQNIYRPCGIPDFLYAFADLNGGKECGLIPDVSKMEFMEKELVPLRAMRYLSAELELEISECITKSGLEVNIANASDIYVLLMNYFIDRKLVFDYS